MGLLGADGWGKYGNSVAAVQKYWQFVDLSNSSIVAGAGRCGGPAFLNTAAAGNGCSIGVQTTNAGGYFGMAQKAINFNGGATSFDIENSSDGVLGFFIFEPSGAVAAWKGPNTILGTLIGRTPTGLVQLNNYAHIGFEWKFHASTGFFRIYVNKGYGDSPDFDSGNVDTTNIWTSGQWDLVYPQPRGYMCDTYWGDFSGSGFDNRFMGDLRVRDDLPQTDAVGGGGFYREWTPSTGTDHGALLDETPPDDGATYVASSTPGQRELCTYPTIPLGVDVRGLLLMPNAVKTSPGGRALGTLVRSGGSNATGASQFVALNDYVYYPGVYPLNPITGLAWTPAEINAMQGGVEITT